MFQTRFLKHAFQGRKSNLENVLSPEGKGESTPDGVQLIFLWFLLSFVASQLKLEFQFWEGNL